MYRQLHRLCVKSPKNDLLITQSCDFLHRIWFKDNNLKCSFEILRGDTYDSKTRGNHQKRN